MAEQCDSKTTDRYQHALDTLGQLDRMDPREALKIRAAFFKQKAWRQRLPIFKVWSVDPLCALRIESGDSLILYSRSLWPQNGDSAVPRTLTMYLCAAEQADEYYEDPYIEQEMKRMSLTRHHLTQQVINTIRIIAHIQRDLPHNIDLMDDRILLHKGPPYDNHHTFFVSTVHKLPVPVKGHHTNDLNDHILPQSRFPSRTEAVLQYALAIQSPVALVCTVLLCTIW